MNRLIAHKPNIFGDNIAYLEAYDLEIGLLINFGAKSLEFKRLINKKFNQKKQGNPHLKDGQNLDNMSEL